VNHAKAEVEGPGGKRTLKETTLDTFERLCTPGQTHASVAFTIGKSVGFGELKVSAHVTLTCDQNEATLNEAGLHAFNKALEFLNDGFSLLQNEEKA
jgi:hypothetical protein